jgi:hypothetical protein
LYYEEELKRMIEGKGLGGKRINPRKVSLTNKEDNDLCKLATACNMAPTTLLWHFARKCLYDPIIMNEFQKKYCTQKAYRVVLINGEFVLSGREDI